MVFFLYNILVVLPPRSETGAAKPVHDTDRRRREPAASDVRSRKGKLRARQRLLDGIMTIPGATVRRSRPSCMPRRNGKPPASSGGDLPRGRDAGG